MKTKMKSAPLIALVILLSDYAGAQWSLTGNAGTNASTNFIGTTDNVAFKIRTKNIVRMTITSGGKMGIGTTTPAFKLDVKGGSINTDSSYRIGGLAVLKANVYSTLVGASAGESITTGNGNTAVGSAALKLNTTGANNTAVGGAALTNNNGYQNTAIGYLCLLSNTTGVNNTASGMSSMLSNTIGYANTSSGYQSLYANTEGAENTGTGVFSLFLNTLGAQNTANGVSAAYSNTTGNANVAVGANALYTNQTENDLVAVGASALYNSTGSSNVAVGSKALYWNSTGSENTAAGKECLFGNFGGTGNTAFGYQALFSNNTGNANTAVGRFSLAANTSGANNSAFGYGADVNTSTLTNATALGSNARVNCSNCLVLGSPTVNVGIGVTTPASKLEVNGTAAKPGGGTWDATSDSRLKQSIQPYSDGLPTLLKIKPVKFHYNEKSGYDTKPEYVGVIAQDLLETAPYMVGTFERNNEQYFSVNNSAMTYMLINAVKELTAKVQQLESEVSQCCTNFQSNSPGTKTGKNSLNEKPILEQNQPNPFSKESLIRFYIPSGISSAKIVVTDLSGHELKSFPVKQSGYGEIALDANELAAGGYLYSLVIDGIKTESKRMELVK